MAGPDLEPLVLMQGLLEDMVAAPRQAGISERSLIPSADEEMNGLSLPDPHPARQALEMMLARRRSAREFSAAPVAIGDLASCLAAADAAPPLAVDVVALAVEGLQSGCYRYVRGPRRLVPLSSVDRRLVATRMLRQPEFGGAAALLLLKGELASAVSSHGSHGYRRLLVDGGAAIHRAWLTALGIGLCGCIFEGLLPDGAQELLGIDGCVRSQLVGLALGWPRPRPGPAR